MGARGPVPLRSSERSRNSRQPEITTIEKNGRVEQPLLGFDDPHPIIRDMWFAMADSAQSEWYEPSDWEYARFTLHFADQLLKNSRPSAQMFAGITSALGDLLVSEGARRRLRLEIERDQSKTDIIDISEMFRERIENA